MAFQLQNWGRVSVTMNSPLVTLTSGALINSPSVFSYQFNGDAQATIGTVGYFNEVYYDLSVNDLIYAVGSDANQFYTVTSIVAGVVTISSFAAAGVIGTANIDNLAVTTAKIANAAVTTTQLDPTTIQYANGTFSSAAFEAAYATPVSILSAPSAGTMIVVQEFVLEYLYVSTAYAAGGNIYLEYGSTAHGTSVATGNIAPAGLTDQSVSGASSATGSMTGLPNTVTAAAAISLTNAGAAFTTGNGTFKWHCWYRIVTQ